MDKELRQKYELSPEKLRYTADPKEFKPTDKIEPGLEAIIIGQEKAVESIQTGLKLEDKHANIFVTGKPGLGKDGILRTVLTQYIENMSPEEYVKKLKQRRDLLAAYNFKQPENPLVLELPTGWGKKFEKDLDQAVNYILKDGIKTYEKQFEMEFILGNQQAGILSKKLKEQQEKLQKEEKKINAEIDKLDKQLQGLQPGSKEAEEYNKKIEKLNQEYCEMDKYSLEKELKIQEEINIVQSQIMEGQKNASTNYKDKVVKPGLEKLKQKYPTQKITNYLEKLEEAIIKDVEIEISVAHINVGAKMSGNMMMQMQMPPPPDMSPYQVKVLNEIKLEEQIKGIPVIFEKKPTLERLFGTVKLPQQVISPNGLEKAKKDNHTRLRAGSFTKAKGGYLILNTAKVVQKDLLALERLFEELDSKKTNIENTRFQYYDSTISEDTDSNVRVIMTGNNGLYQQLKSVSSAGFFEEFNKTFGIKAELDSVTGNTPKTRELYSKYVARICKKEGLKNVTPEGITKIIEHSARLADEQEKLTLNLSEISNVIREANLRAGDSKYITAEHVGKAIEFKRGRHNLIERKYQEFINDKKMFIDTEKCLKERINGLVVYSLEDIRFGLPQRISVVTSLGKDGVISVDRKAKLTGPIAEKAEGILEGNLKRLFGQDKRVPLDVSLSFEQSYGGIEGDSATLAEFLVTISSLSKEPIYQGIAVTGSLNQHGEVQPIGGVNEKIEGVYDICKARGLNGEQGVMIPKSNTDDLMLKEGIIKDVKEKKFHIYAVETAEEAAEVMLGLKVGYINDGNFEEGTLYYKANEKIKEMNNLNKEK